MVNFHFCDCISCFEYDESKNDESLQMGLINTEKNTKWPEKTSTCEYQHRMYLGVHIDVIVYEESKNDGSLSIGLINMEKNTKWSEKTSTRENHHRMYLGVHFDVIGYEESKNHFSLSIDLMAKVQVFQKRIKRYIFS